MSAKDFSRRYDANQRKYKKKYGDSPNEFQWFTFMVTEGMKKGNKQSAKELGQEATKRMRSVNPKAKTYNQALKILEEKVGDLPCQIYPSEDIIGGIIIRRADSNERIQDKVAEYFSTLTGWKVKIVKM